MSSETFSPGDQIFLKCGETWTDTLTLDGADSDIIISSYGACSTLGRPKITSSGTVNSFIKIANASYVSIMGLDISGTATYAIDLTDAGTGITIERSIIKSSGSGIIYAPNGAGFTLVNNLLTTTDTGTTIIHVANGSRANIFDNTLVGGYESILLDNTAGNILANNTFYNPYASALVVRETTSAPPGQVTDNIFSSNTLLTWNPSFPMVHLENQNGGTGSLIALVSNTYVNVYKPTLPLVDFVSSGSVTQTFSKDTIINIDQ